jgi:hypothetical protein
VIEFHTENSPFWEKQSTWIKTDTLETPYTYNTKELNATELVTFATDLTDEYTIINYDSTSYQVSTKPKTFNNESFSTIYGLGETRLPVCLGNRKDSLNGLEKVLSFLAGVFDDLAKVLFINLGLQQKIKSKIGVLKVSHNNHSIPKLLWIEGDRLPSDHRGKFSAVTLWDKYHTEKSFITNNYNNYKRQRKVYNDVETPFGFEDFVKLVNSSYFKTFDGRNGKVLNIAWNMAHDKAKLDYYIEEVYTTNLEETFINP